MSGGGGGLPAWPALVLVRLEFVAIVWFVLGKMGITGVNGGWTDTLIAPVTHMEMLTEH